MASEGSPGLPEGDRPEVLAVPGRRVSAWRHTDNGIPYYATIEHGEELLIPDPQQTYDFGSRRDA